MKLPGRNRRRENSSAPDSTEPDTTTEASTAEVPAEASTAEASTAEAGTPDRAATGETTGAAAADRKATGTRTAGTRASAASGGGVRNRMRRFLQKPGSADLSQYTKLMPQIAGHEDRLRELTDEELTAAAGDSVEDAELCAVGREAARRALGERPFDVQLTGTLAMLSGQIAEMATGEGKTLAGAIAAAGYALSG